MHRTSVMGKLVHEVRLLHEDGSVAHGAAMRQPGEEDQVSNILLSTVAVSYTHLTLPTKA